MNNINPNKNIFTIFIIYLAVSLIFIFVVRNYSGSQLDRELVKVQTHISGLVNIRSNAIDKWVADKRSSIDSISDNLTVKMYLTSVDMQNTSKDDLLTQEQFTLAYLESVAKNSGFKNKVEKTNIKANVPVNSDSAIALITKNGSNRSLSIGYADNLNEIIGELGGLARAENVSFIRSSVDKATYLRIVKPISKVQSDEVIGYVVAVKKLDKDFFDLLDFPPTEYKTSNSELVSVEGTKLQFITEKPSNDPIITLEKNDDMAEIYAINHPDVISEKNDSHDNRVFVSARNLGYGDIFLVHTLSYKESFAEAINSSKSLRHMSYLVVLLLGAIIAFVWKHSTSEKYKKLTKELKEKQRLLQIISENQIQSMFLLDDDSKVAFANSRFVKKNKINDESEFLNKDIASVIGASAANDFANLSVKAHDTGMSVTNVHISKVKGKERFSQQRVIPIDTDKFDDRFTGTLIIENDITDLMNERIKYETNLNNSIEILVRIIENRSKYFYNHGAQVHELSMKIADNLNIPDVSRKAVDIASRISNLSLALLPRELINKQGELTQEEKDIFNDIPQKTIEIISDFNFDSPVTETLEQVAERVDGQGPRKMVGDQIIISARIIKVVNDYVAMTSPRPYRDKLTSAQAVENLLKDKDTKYNKDVVFALANIVSAKNNKS